MKQQYRRRGEWIVSEQGESRGEFGSGFEADLALLRRTLTSPNLRLETVSGPEGNQCVVAYLAGSAAPETVQALRDWAGGLSLVRAEMPWWRAAVDALRLPPLIEARSPGGVAASLREGYLAIFAENGSGPLLGPTTLDLLLTFPKDAALSPGVRRLVTWPRIMAALVGLLAGALLVAVSSYHHALIPAPFLVSMAATRQNMPFPIVLEMLMVALLSDGIEATSARVGGKESATLSLIAFAVMVMAAMQVGIIGPTAGVTGFAAAVLRALLPNRETRRAIRLWRYLFIGAAVGLGVYGLTLAVYAMVVYFGEEERFGQRLWRRPGEPL